MTFFELLRERAKTHEKVIASRSSRRVVTYRKLWSRIERGTARLKSEWQIAAGDTIAYWGLGHQDALMLYLAAARCGARLLPLEHLSLQQASVSILQRYPVKLLVHDDDVMFAEPPAVPVLVNLSSLIATRCHHMPVVHEDTQYGSLIALVADADGAFKSEEKSLHELALATVGNPSPELRIDAALFDNDVFAPQVLSTLKAGGTIVFR